MCKRVVSVNFFDGNYTKEKKEKEKKKNERKLEERKVDVAMYKS